VTEVPTTAPPATIQLAPRSASFTLSCVVPVHNEQEVVADFLRALHATAAKLTPRFEIIVVNDGSTDATGRVVRELAPELSLSLIELSRNFGKEAALTAGLDLARGDCVLLIDADFQHPLESVADLVGAWRAGYDMAYGLRTDRSGESWLKRAGSRLFYRLMASSQSIDIPPDAGDFRVMDRRVVEALKRLPERHRFMKGLYAWVGFRSVGIPFEVRSRAGGTTSFSMRRLQSLAITGITAFSNLPLRIGGAVGAVIALLAFVWGGWIVIERLVFGQPIQGFATLAASVLLFAGIQLISIGVLGEYLGRVYDEVKARPTYLVARLDDYSPLRDGGPVASPLPKSMTRQ
jgi:glycosyltransferase involved in cell wall biosynthesis